MATAYKIQGLDDCIRCLDQAPENVLRMTKKAMREGGKQTARAIRQRTPKRFRRLVGYKVTKGQVSGDTFALVGLFNKERSKNGNVVASDWFKAYWKNYGTLTRRYSGHQFVTPIKPRVRTRRNSIGQNPELFFENAIPGWDEQFMSAFEKSMKEQEDTLYDR